MSTDKSEPLRLRLRLDGEDIEPGKISFRDLKNIADLTQAGLERTAKILRESHGSGSGKSTRALRDATELLLVGIEEGSAVAIAELRQPRDEDAQDQLPSLPPRDLGIRALETFIDGLRELETNQEPRVPAKWDNSVMDVAEQLARFTSERNVSLSMTTESAVRPAHAATVTGSQAEKLSIRHVAQPRRRSVRGELILIDLDTERIDIKDLSGRRTHCTFADSTRDQVLALVGHQVMATGEEDVETSTGRASPLRIESLVDAGEQMALGEDFWRNPSAEEQAMEQRTKRITSVAELADPSFDEAEIDAFLSEIRGG